MPSIPAHVPQPPAELQRQPLVANYRSFGWISDRVCGLAEGKAPFWWWVLFVPAFGALCMLMFCLSYQVSTGVGVWGNMHPVMCDRARSRIRQFLYGIGALGWTGSNRHWSNYEKAYLLLAGLSTPLVLSVHSIVSFDFAVSQVPGWHTTIFPPYFVAGAIFSGFGMVLSLMIPLRTLCKLQDVITVRHVDLMCKVIMATGSMVGYAYGMEFFIAWYSGNPYELYAFKNRAFGPYWWAYWTMITCNVVSPQLFWFKAVRQNMVIVFILSIFVNIGMWFERFVIIVTSLHRDYMPSNWAIYSPTWVDIWQFIGTFGLFMTLYLLFMRFLPAIAIGEVKGVTPQADPHHPLGGAKGGH